MNNLFWIPGIICQGDDGRPVSKPKQTDNKNTHSVSQGRVMRLPEAARHILCSFSDWKLWNCPDENSLSLVFRSGVMNV